MKIMSAMILSLSLANIPTGFAAQDQQLSQFTFKNAEIEKVAEVLGKKLNKTFIIDPTVKGKITILSSKPMSAETSYNAFLIVLAIDGATTVEQGDFIKIVSAQAAQRSSSEVFAEMPDIKQEKMVTVIFTLKFAIARKVFNELGPILVSRYGEMRIVEDSNAMIVSDFTSNLYRVKKILEGVDIKH